MSRHRHRPPMLAAVLAAAAYAIAAGRAAIINTPLTEQPPSPTAGTVHIVTSPDTLPLAHDIMDGYTARGQALTAEIAIQPGSTITQAVLISQADLGITILPAAQGEGVEMPNWLGCCRRRCAPPSPG